MGRSRKEGNRFVNNNNNNNSSDYLQWQKIFNSLVQMLKSQQSQLETLANDRKLLEDRIQIQHDRWLSDARLLEEHISQLKSHITEGEIEKLLDAAKLDLVVGLKQREASFYKSISEQTENDLKDMRQAIECLSRKLLELKENKGKDKSREGDGSTLENSKEMEKRTKRLQDEVKKLKQANEKLSSQKNTEVSALIAERNFVWNQFKKMENHSTSLLKTKQEQLDKANENTAKLDSLVEKLQMSMEEKENNIVMLKAEVSKLEMDIGFKNNELSKLSEELKCLKSARKQLTATVMGHKLEPCKNSSKSSVSVESGKRNRLNKEPSKLQASAPAKFSEIESKKSSRKRGTEAISNLEPPRLFSSGFKVPKLKISSPLG